MYVCDFTTYAAHTPSAILSMRSPSEFPAPLSLSLPIQVAPPTARLSAVQLPVEVPLPAVLLLPFWRILKLKTPQVATKVFTRRFPADTQMLPIVISSPLVHVLRTFQCFRLLELPPTIRRVGPFMAEVEAETELEVVL
jgi:hypothetical protein